MAVIIAVTNHKGGVAKTSSVSAIGSIFAASGNKVLMLDLDTQANLTYSFIDPAAGLPERCLFDAVRERRDLPQVCIKENLYIVPCGLEMALVESDMFNAKRREYILQDLIRPVAGQYDVIFLDCPPSLGIMTLNALTIADRVLVPMHADQLSYYGLKMMVGYLELQHDLNPDLRVDDIFFTHYDSREKQTKNVEALVREEFGDAVLKSVIRKNVSIGEAVTNLCSVIDYKPDSNGAQDYLSLAKELKGRL